MSMHFTPAALKFLKGLAKNNDREWFEARRPVFEGELKAPMLALIEEINHGMLSFAPDHVRPANKIMMRIYRDTRFAKDKRPYKHHVAAWWARRGMEKTGGGFYLHISPAEVMIATGVYMPEREQLLAIRRWMADNHEDFRTLQKKILKPRRNEPAPMSLIGSAPLTRMPKGFPTDHPADELLRAHNWGVHMLLPSEAALQPPLGPAVIAAFKRSAPLIDTLNEAIETASRPAKKPLFGLDF